MTANTRVQATPARSPLGAPTAALDRTGSESPRNFIDEPDRRQPAAGFGTPQVLERQGSCPIRGASSSSLLGSLFLEA